MRGEARGRRALLTVGLVTLGCGTSAWLTGRAVGSVAGDRNAPWILGRASGVTGYLLLVALVALGLMLSHPRRVHWHRPTSSTRIRLHVSLAAFTLGFIALHIVVLATDEYAQVGWSGAVLPMASRYRPAAVTLGLIGTYAGLLAGLTAAFAGRWARRLWWPVHKVSAGSLVLVWAHGVLAGGDSPALWPLYLSTAIGILLLALSRYTSATPADRVRDLVERDQPARVQGALHR